MLCMYCMGGVLGGNTRGGDVRARDDSGVRDAMRDAACDVRPLGQDGVGCRDTGFSVAEHLSRTPIRLAWSNSSMPGWGIRRNST